MSFRHLRVGDKVTRLLSAVPMPLVVTQVSDTEIKCGLSLDVTDPGSLWTFDRETGVEIDEDLGWGPAHGVTGSVLQEQQTIN